MLGTLIPVGMARKLWILLALSAASTLVINAAGTVLMATIGGFVVQHSAVTPARLHAHTQTGLCRQLGTSGACGGCGSPTTNFALEHELIVNIVAPRPRWFC